MTFSFPSRRNPSLTSSLNYVLRKENLREARCKVGLPSGAGTIRYVWLASLALSQASFFPPGLPEPDNRLPHRDFFVSS